MATYANEIATDPGIRKLQTINYASVTFLSLRDEERLWLHEPQNGFGGREFSKAQRVILEFIYVYKAQLTPSQSI